MAFQREVSGVSVTGQFWRVSGALVGVEGDFGVLPGSDRGFLGGLRG